MNHVLATQRLCVRRAEPMDAEFVHSLWTSPPVMRFVGFPMGLRISLDEVRRTIECGSKSEFGVLLIVSIQETNKVIGQCTIGVPDAEGICEPDIKLKPDTGETATGRNSGRH